MQNQAPTTVAGSDGSGHGQRSSERPDVGEERNADRRRRHPCCAENHARGDERGMLQAVLGRSPGPLLPDERDQKGRRQGDVDREPDPGHRLREPAGPEGERPWIAERVEQRERREREREHRHDPRAAPLPRSRREDQRQRGTEIPRAEECRRQRRLDRPCPVVGCTSRRSEEPDPGADRQTEACDEDRSRERPDPRP